MAAIEEVSRFSGSSAAEQGENARLLARSRDRVASRLRQVLRAVLAEIHTDLLHRGELAEAGEQRHFLYAIRDTLMESGVRLESLLVRHWCREFDAANGGRPLARLSVLSLDGSGDQEEERALLAIAECLRERYAQALAAIGRQLEVLSGHDRAGAPEVLCRALYGALTEAGFGRPARLDLLRSMLPLVGAGFAVLYDEWGGESANDTAQPRVAAASDRAAAEAALTAYLALPLPAVAAQLLTGEWRDLLVRVHAEGDRDAWDAACAAAGELVWSVRIAPGSRERKLLVGRLPNLLKRLHDGFERLEVDAGRRVELLDGLFAVHAAILRGDPPPAIPALVRIGVAVDA